MSRSFRHFLSLREIAREDLDALCALALRLKRRETAVRLPGRILGMLFFNPSVRTRASFESAMARLGGASIALAAGRDTWNFEHREGVAMDGATQEHVKELAPVLSRYCDALGVRKSELVTTSATTAEVSGSWDELKRDAFLRALARYATVPVINLESNADHPCQGLADRMTLLERFPGPGGARGAKYVLTWAWHTKSLPMATPNSQLEAAASLGMDVTLLCPEGWELDPDVTAAARASAGAAGGGLRVTHDRDEALAGAKVLCAKEWGSIRYYGRFDEERRDKERLREDWRVDGRWMARTAGASFMHCLPVRRGVVVADEVLDSPASIVVEQAENRMWAQMALLASLLGEVG